MPDNPAQVIGLVATFRRNQELQRLFQALAAQTVSPSGLVIADNAADPACQDLVAHAPFPAHYLTLPDNPGCGAGLRAAEETALTYFPQATHWWILDDDALPPPNALERLLQALHQSGAAMTVPLLTDHLGHLWAFPEPAHPAFRKIIRQESDPKTLCRRIGPGPHPACWATGACQLVQIQAAREVGLHRTDFWMLGEDLDFSMRLAVGPGLCFITDLVVPHLPPQPPSNDPTAPVHARRKFRALLQNLTYLALRCPAQSAHLFRYLPGNYRRYFRTYGYSFRSAREVATCFWKGAICGQPAGSKP